MKNIFKNALLSTVVFGMAIASGFAMDNNPPSEPVKKVVETETMQTVVNYGYIDANNDCVFYMVEPENPTCSTVESIAACTVTVGFNTYHLRLVTKDPITNEWNCGALLYEIL